MSSRPGRSTSALRTALGGVVVDDIQEDLDAGLVEVLHHLLELGDLLTVLAAGGVRRVGGEEADRVVAPIVGQTSVDDSGLAEELLDRQQLDRRHTQVAQIVR